MSGKKTLFDARWDVDKYRSSYDSEHWDLCRSFMETHKTKYPEQKLAHLTEAFYQMGVYGSSYDPKTTRLVNSLTIEVLDDVLKSHPGLLYHPFDKSAVKIPEQSSATKSQSPMQLQEQKQPSSIWDVQVDQNIIVNVLIEPQLKELFKGFVIIYDIRRTSTLNDNKVSILEESFKRSKFGPCHWTKDDTHNNICPIRISLKWRNVVLAEAVGADENSLKTRLAQAILSKMACFSSGIEAKWSYYRDGGTLSFENPNPRKSNIYKVMRRSQFKAMAEIESFIDTFANSDSFAEAVFSMDFSNQEKKQLMEYIDKSWCTKLTYRTFSKLCVKNKSDSHVFVYHIRTGEELRRWLEQTDGENDRYRLVPPGKHRRAGSSDNNVREVLTTNAVEMPKEADAPAEKQTKDVVQVTTPTVETEKDTQKAVSTKKSEQTEEIRNEDSNKNNKNAEAKDTNKKDNKTLKSSQEDENDIEKLLDGFVLFYDANKTSEIDKDDWFLALCESFKLSKFGPLEVISENIRALRTRCVFKWKDRTLASAEGLTETQAKTAATLQLISKLEPFTYIIQAKEEYFCEGKVPPFMEDANQSKSSFYRVVRRKDLPSYYNIFQTIDEFCRTKNHGELIFGPDFTWELKNEIVVYLKAQGLSHRYFTMNEQKPWTHMAIYHTVKPDELKEHLLKSGGENEKYKLIPPPKAEPISDKTSEEKSAKEPGKPSGPASAEKPLAKVAEKRKQQEAEPPPVFLAEDFENNKIQIKLKKFKVDKVDYPEDTGGDFPGLIIWIGIRKNSVWQKNLFSILLESFKMSKFGELIIDESEENVWGKREPFKKCVIKSSRKVLAVGLGQSKREAKDSASLQVLRQLRKHCYTIQAKESYFREGKATPYNFNPDPAKEHVYKLIKRNRFKDRAAIIMYVTEFSKNSCSEELIFGDDFTYDERGHILDHCRSVDLGFRLMKCQSVSKNMHTHIAIFHRQPPPVIKAELIKAGGENDMYRLIPPGGKITNQNNDADLWPETLENGKQQTASSTTNLPVQQNCISQSNEPQPAKQQSQTTEQTATKSSPIPSLLNRFPVSASAPSVNFGQKGSGMDRLAPAIHTVDSTNPDKNLIPVKISGIQENRNLAGSNNKKVNALPGKSNNEVAKNVSQQPLKSQPKGPQPIQNQPKGAQPVQNQPKGAQPVQNQPKGAQPVQNLPKGLQPLQNQLRGPQPLQSQPIGLQPQFVSPHLQEVQVQPFHEVPFGPQPLLSHPPPPIFIQPFMDRPLQFGRNPPVFLPQHPCDILSVGMDVGMPTMIPQMEMVNQPMSGNVQMPINADPQAKQTHNDVPPVQITVQNSPRKPDLREELAKKRQAENRKSSPDRKVYDMTERMIINKEEKDSDGWSRKVFVAELAETAKNEEQRRDAPGQNVSGSKEKAQDLREKLRHKEPPKEINASVKPAPKRNVPQRDTDRRRSPYSDRQRMSPERSRSRDVSRERWRSSDRSERIIRQREGSYERRVFHDPTRNIGEDRIPRDRFRSRSRSRSPSFTRRIERSLVHQRDLWDNIPARHSESIFMYKYVKQNSTTETDPYALLRATRSPSFNVDFEFIKEQTAIDEWYVSVELVPDDANIHPLVGEGVASTEREASLRAAYHAVDTVQKACRVIEPKYRYFCEGGVPEFIARKSPMKTSVYEIIQNMDPDTPLARYTVEMMFKMFITSDLEDLFFLATDFSYLERVLVIDMATQMNLWWRLFGPRHPDARPDDIVSTQHVCVYKQKSALQLSRELIANGGSTEKYTLVDPREYRLTQPRFERTVR